MFAISPLGEGARKYYDPLTKAARLGVRVYVCMAVSNHIAIVI